MADEKKDLTEAEAKERYGIEVSDSKGADAPDVAEVEEVAH